jgi:hypothetical protein
VRTEATKSFRSAGGREDKALYAGDFGKFGEPHRSQMVDLVRKLWIPLPKGSLDNAAKCTTASKPSSNPHFQVTKICVDLRNRRTGRSEIAALKQVSVKSHDLVSARKQTGAATAPM